MIKTATRTIRCAVYTRKSTDEGLDRDFNSLDAQREAAEAYIASQKAEGWVCSADKYDDGGFTGGNMDRPAVKRLLADVAAGKVDCIVVYKVDRLSRSLLDFARIMESLDQHNVSFVSVTQQFNTTTSMGRLMLNVLLSFAQFEREIIGERTRDKMSAARRKGKWVGGTPVLGYDIDPDGGRLLVNEDEAARVRAIFELYADHQSLIATVQECDRRGWTNKQWRNKKGLDSGGKPLDKAGLLRMLSNVIYLGKVNHKGQIFPGEHPPIVGEDLWEKVHVRLRRNAADRGTSVRNKHGALLQGLLHCTPCGCAMTHAYTAKGTKRYRYYVCVQAQKRGWDTCPTKSVPAAEIERFVVDQIRCIGEDRAVVLETLRRTRDKAEDDITGLQAERRLLERELTRHQREVGKVAGRGDGNRLADIQDRMSRAELRLTEIRSEMATLEGQQVSEDELAAALAQFDPVWDSLAPREQVRLIQLLVERVGYDGREGTVSVTLRPAGIKTLAAQGGRREEVQV
jgi:site-specific DNA recombinase